MEGANNNAVQATRPRRRRGLPAHCSNTRTTILIVADYTAARLTIAAMISNDAIAAKPINAAELRAVVYAAVRMRRWSLTREDQSGS